MARKNVVIIGSGPAGYSAAVYAARADLAPLVLAGFQKGGPPGGQLTTTTDVENYLGFPEGISGPALMERAKEQAERFGARVLNQDVQAVDFSRRPFRVSSDEADYEADTVVISTGAAARRLGTEAERRFWNRGISACATCDGALPLFRNKTIVVVGGGDTAMEEALFLTRFASRVVLVHRREEFRASKIMQDRVMGHPKITPKTPYALENTHGGKTLETVTLKNVETGAVEDLAAGGLFLAIGHEPNTGLFRGQIDLDDAGYIKTDGRARTSVPGVFAAGDCVDRVYRQAITAAGQGCMAAIEAARYLERQEQPLSVQKTAV